MPALGTLSVRVLGSTELSVAGEPIRLDRPLERALAVRLALARGKPVADETVGQDLWSDTGFVAQDRLRVVAHRLRRTLGDHAGALQRHSHGYAFTAIPTDLVAVEDALPRIRASQRDDASRYATIIDALKQWRGLSLADLRSFPFGSVEGARLDAVELDLQVHRYEAELDQGRPVGADLERLVAEHPLHERLVGLSAIALYRAGRQADGLERLANLRHQLAEELGVDPSPYTAELELKLLRQDPALLARDVVQPPLADRRWSNPTTTFVGRDGERAELLAQLTGSAVVTLTGGPGVGKTRLAREVARGADRRVVWLDLAPVSDAAALPFTLAAAIGEQGQIDTVTRCATKLADALLVIDNAEHLVEPVAKLVTELRRRASELAILTTSQRPLRIAAEEILQLGPLGPDAAATLFCDRSGASPDHHVDAICAAVDRLPLAIELAAGLTRTLTVPQLADRIDQRLRLLVGGSRDTGTRHVSLRNAVEWSHSLLDPPTQAVLRGLSVFVGGCTLEAAEHVIGGAGVDPSDVPILLADLYDRNLITSVDKPLGRRFGLLETIREHALEQLRLGGEETEFRRRHAAWCAELATSTDQRVLAEEELNLRAALTWSLNNGDDPLQVADIAIPTGWCWWGRGTVGNASEWLARYRDAAEQAPPTQRATVLCVAAALTRDSGDFAEARALGDEALEIYYALDDVPGQITTLLGLCVTSYAMQEYGTAQRQGEESRRLAQAVGNKQQETAAINALGCVLRAMGRTTEAEALLMEAHDLWLALDDQRGLLATLGNLAMVARQQGDLTKSRRLCLDVLRRCDELAVSEGQIDMLEALAILEQHEDRPAEALRLLTVAEEARDAVGVKLIVPDELTARDAACKSARTALGAEAAHVIATARALPFSSVVAELLVS